jgi:hypothetical protein
MIPRYQRIAFWTLSAAILLMAVFTIYERQKSHDRVTASTDAMPYIEPVNAQTEPVTLDLANDVDGTIISGLRDVALPEEPSLRARALLDRLFNEYTLPNSQHRLKAGPAVDDVFILKTPLPGTPANVLAPFGILAVVNLHSAFADAHPSGVLIEDLTIRSVLGTLHANLPEITHVRFLVDGQPRDTLAGHADLLRTYPTEDTAAQLLQPTHPIENRQP